MKKIFSKIEFLNFPTGVKSGFTLAETLIVLAIIAVVALVAVVVFQTNGMAQKELLTRYDKAYTDLEQIAQVVSALNTDRQPLGAASKGGFDYLSCSGVTDNTECLKRVILKNSQAGDCKDNNCMPNFTEETLPTVKGLNAAFSSLNAAEFKMLRLPSGAVVAMRYLDKTCKLKMPVSGTEIIPDTCALLVVDVNGDKKPNKYTVNGEGSDTFIFALQKDGVKGSAQAIVGLAGCKNGETPDFATGTCSSDVKCPTGTEKVEQGTLNAFKYKDRWGNYGWCKLSCPSGQDMIGGVCVPGCEMGETLINGVCMPDDCAIPENQISTQPQLEAIPDSSSNTYCLMNDIPLTYDVASARISTSYGWLPIADFGGKFYGNGYAIKNFFIGGGVADYWGLFANITSTAVVDGVGLEAGPKLRSGYSIYTSNYQEAVGSIAGKSEGIISNSYNTCSIHTSAAPTYGTGGIVGTQVEGSIVNTFNMGNIEAVGRTGGLVGQSDGGSSSKFISNSYNVGNISTILTRSPVGGIAAMYNGTITNSYNKGTISGTGMFFGGLIGSAKVGAKVYNSFNAGAINYNGYYVAEGAPAPTRVAAGGLIGEGTQIIENSYNSGNLTINTSDHNSVYGCGLGCDYLYLLQSVKKSYNSGAVSVVRNSPLLGRGLAVGLVGGIFTNPSSNFNFVIENCYNAGTVSIQGGSPDSVGLFGQSVADDNGLITVSITNSYNSGSIPSGSYRGGINIEKKDYVTLANNFFIDTIVKCSGQTTTPTEYEGCTQSSDADFKNPSTFSSWDQLNTWSVADEQYPDLLNLIMPPRNNQLGSWATSAPGVWEWKSGATRPTLINNPEP